MSFLSATGGGGVDASGGTTVTTFTDNTGTEYQIHAFENVGNDTFTVNSGGEVDVLVVGGGGGGNGDHANAGSGGGAGGFVYYKGHPIQSGNFNVVVGQGGAGASNTPSPGDDGGDSSFGTLQTAFGGGGGVEADTSGRNGGSGSGSGGGGRGGTGGNGVTNQGNDGGDHNGSFVYSAAGGGGAKERGADGDSNGQGFGGDGYTEGDTVFNFEDGSNVIFEIDNTGRAFAGGGAGGLRENDVNSLPRSVGGGGGTSKSAGGEDGFVNSGGGGGGGQGYSANPNAGDGGSGIVLIRYEI